MSQIQVVSVTPQDKGKRKIQLENGIIFSLYVGECRKYAVKEDGYLSEEEYQTIIKDVLMPRARRRAMHILEKVDRTRKQLYDKLVQNGYPEECIEAAIEYVESYHYIDDLRYAKNYVRYHQENRSSQRLKMDLYKRGVPKEIIEQAIEEEYQSDEIRQIVQILQKRKFSFEQAEQVEFRKNYQYLLRRGFRSNDILKVMKCRIADFDI